MTTEVIRLSCSMLRGSSPARRWRIQYSGARRTLFDGPYAETKELMAGYTVIQVKSREEAIEWTKRFPNSVVDGTESEIELLQLFELKDLCPSEAVERFRDLGVGKRQWLDSRPANSGITLHLKWRKRQ